MNIKECTNPTEWNEFVGAHGTIHHLYEWSDVNWEGHGFPTVNLACWDGSKIVAIYPFIIKGRWPLRWYMAQTDFGGGPIGDPQAVELLIEEVYRRARHKGIAMNFIRFGNHDMSLFKKLGFKITERRNLVIDLNRSEEEIWRSFRDKIRNSVRKSEKQGIQVTEGSVSDLDEYLELSDKLSQVYGYSPRPKAFVRALFKYLDTTMLLARWREKLVGGCIYLKYKQRAYGIHASRDPDQGKLRIGEAVHWAGIRYFKQKDYLEYDFLNRNDNYVDGEKVIVAPSHASLHRFKLNWRPMELPHYDLVMEYSQWAVGMKNWLAKLKTLVGS